MTDDFSAEWIANNVVEAQLAEGALKEAGIPYVVDNFQLNPYDGALASQAGWGRIRVRPHDADRAREIIKQALTPNADEDTSTDA